MALERASETKAKSWMTLWSMEAKPGSGGVMSRKVYPRRGISLEVTNRGDLFTLRSPWDYFPSILPRQSSGR